ncbi:DUF3025 domain-containing protein [Hydrogenophaga sp. 5NK40-0174]|uniref:DUF3025 domain-containing protein n=1 Tax=Hydrogenophaga sp. 5NK40-0174 TaxID=3127649 RepID=UPI003105DAB1
MQGGGEAKTDVDGWGVGNWQSPWFDDVRTDGKAVAEACHAGRLLPEALSMHVAQAYPAWTGPSFVPQTALPEGQAYESFIFQTRQVPTREGLHDFFNALIWMRFPGTKLCLNRLQAAQIQADGVQSRRGPVRDAITVFDENAALLQAPDTLWEALLARDWVKAFVELRPLWAQARIVLFGHALLEKLVEPYKSITAHVFRQKVPLSLGSDLSAWDAWLAGSLDASVLAAKPFTPLPVMGLPGWCEENEDAAYYADRSVFRPPRPAVQAGR